MTDDRPVVGQDSCRYRPFTSASQEWWENNDEKPTTIALGIAAFVGLWATSGLLDSINKLPLIGGVFEVRKGCRCLLIGARQRFRAAREQARRQRL